METDNTRLENQTRRKKNEAGMREGSSVPCRRTDVTRDFTRQTQRDYFVDRISSRASGEIPLIRHLRSNLLPVAVNLGRRSIDRSIDRQMLESVNHLCINLHTAVAQRIALNLSRRFPVCEFYASICSIVGK